MRYLLLILYGCLNLLSAEAYCSKDSIPQNKERRNKLVFNFDGRRSFIAHQNVKIGGVRLGVQHLNKWRVGIGLYILSSPIERPAIIDRGLASQQSVTAKLKFNYFAYFFEYIWYKTKRREISTPLIWGIGNSRLEYIDANKNTFRTNEKTVMLLEPSLLFEYKFFYWLGAGVGIGGRKMIRSNDLIEENFNSPIYIIKMKLFIGELFKKRPKENAP